MTLSTAGASMPDMSKPSDPSLTRFKPIKTGQIVLSAYRERIVSVVLGGICILVGGVLALLVPKYTGLAVDSVRALGDLTEDRVPDRISIIASSIAGIDSTASDAMSRCLAAIAISAQILGLLQFLKRYQLVGLSRQSEFALRQGLFRHIQTLPLDTFTRLRSGDLLNRATSDIEAVRMMTGPAMMYLTDVAILLPLTVAAMFMISPALAAWALVPLALLTISTVLFSPKTRKYSQEVQERQSDLSARAQENFSGVRVVKAFGRENFESEEFDKLGRQVLESQLSLARNRTAYQSLIWTLNGAGLLVFLYFGAREIAAGALSIGQFLEFNLFFTLLYWPMISLGWVIMLIVRGRVSARRINEILAIAPDPGLPGDPYAEPPTGPEPQLRGEVEFRNVGFSFTAGKPVLQDISFRVAPGRTLAVVGPVGCGKTTVAQLLLRLREPGAGEILIDGKPIQEWDPHYLRRRMGFVPQETFLFSESIAENLGFGVNAAERSLLVSAAETAQLAPELATLPDGYDTVLGERGVNLSGGQKQRAAIARALVKRPDIMVLDDCLSAVDTRTEEAILSGLRRELRDTTVVIIAQRVSTVAHADEIVVLDDGRVVERGTDAELRARGGLYAAMAEAQQLAEAIAGEG